MNERLLTDEEIFEIGQNTPIEKLYWYQVGLKIAEAQDAKTYPIAFEEGHGVGIAKCQAKLERIFKEIDPLIGRYKNCDYVCGEPKIPCGLANKCYYAKWQNLKKQEGL